MIAALLTSLALATGSPAPADAFLSNLQTLCGQSFAGRVVTDDPADKAFAESELVMLVRDCSADEVRIPFRVGEDRSRTWVLTRTPEGLRLKHDHRHADGSEDVLSQYGGDTTSGGSAVRQEFPADGFSKDLFQKHGNPASVTNVWAAEVHPGRTFAYELRRPNRHFRVEFDLTRPLPQP
ncbi:MAG TPA: hypothetical protein VEA79_10815 [Phenylobacterium sp.]|nr:hypothetical protein [Phenylobacterium sp.]